MSMTETCWNCAATKIWSARQMIREAEFTKGRIGPPLNRQMGLVPARWPWNGEDDYSNPLVMSK